MKNRLATRQDTANFAQDLSVLSLAFSLLWLKARRETD